MSKTKFKITNIDIFALINFCCFLFMCYAAYFNRFIHYRGREYLNEFIIYAIAILLTILAVWRITRRIPFPTWILVPLQIGILIHFTGGLSIFNNHRMYDTIIFNIRYDKYVHLINACSGGFVLHKLYFERIELKQWLKDLQIIVLILGIGAVIEIIEYLVTLTVDINGVGGYNNNMRDLIANLTGAMLSVLMLRAIALFKGKRVNDTSA